MKSEFPNNDQRLAVCNSQWKEKKRSKNKMKIERRFLPQEDAEVRILREDGKPTKIVGYFAKFNKLSRDLGGFKEKISRGFFKEALKDSDVVDLFNHDHNFPLGRESAFGDEGKLKVWEDKVGLRYELTPLQTQTIEDRVLIPIDKGVIKGNSFGFRIKGGGDTWDESDDGTIRTLMPNGCSHLVDGSQVLFPAYDGTGVSLRMENTEVALRSLEDWKEENKVETKDEVATENIESKENRDLENKEDIENNSVENSNDSENDNNENDNNENRESEQNDNKDESNPDNVTIDSEQDSTENETVESVSLKTIGLKLKTNQQIIDNE